MMDINFIFRQFMQKASGSYEELYFGTYYGTSQAQAFEATLSLSIKVGNKYWNGASWSTTSSNFLLYIKNGKIQSNKDSSMNVDGTSGWFIPVSNMEGVIEFSIENIIMYNHNHYSTYEINPYSNILSDLEITYLELQSITASQRSNNIYRSVLLSGFSEEKEVNLTLGTFNNNIASPVFLRDRDNAYIEQISYFGEDPRIIYEQQRPEMHLLDRVVAYYSEVRRAFNGIIAIGIEIMLTRYTYLSRVFMAIDANHNWRDDEQNVKFIEVT